MLSGVDDTGAAAAFDRMKDKVEMMETRAEVSVGLLPSGRLEDRFKQLEQGNVDDELAELKGRMDGVCTPVHVTNTCSPALLQPTKR